MVEHNRWLTLLTHLVLLSGVATVGLPLWYAFVAATLTFDEVMRVPLPLLPGGALLDNLSAAFARGDLGRKLANSAVMASVIAAGKIAVSLLSAFAIVYFRFRFRGLVFGAIFVTLMLPIEVRIVPTYEVAANMFAPLVRIIDLLGLREPIDGAAGFRLVASLDFSLLDSYLGLTLPLIASATATFLFRQFYLTVPDELCEAAKIDGAGPLRFFRDVLLPLSTTNIAALGVILFVFGWNQYLWPLLITTDAKMATVVMGVARMMPGNEPLPEWHLAMAAGLIAMLPPVIVVLVLQRWFVKGLIDSEK